MGFVIASVSVGIAFWVSRGLSRRLARVLVTAPQGRGERPDAPR